MPMWIGIGKPPWCVKIWRAINIAIDNHADIINISGGEFSTSGASETLLANAIKKCEEKGILIVAAAGNDGCECLHLPAAESSVLAVGAMDKTATNF